MKFSLRSHKGNAFKRKVYDSHSHFVSKQVYGSENNVYTALKRKAFSYFGRIFVSLNHAQTIQLYQPLLHTIAYNLVRCKEDAEDIVQETFARWLSIDHQKIQNTKAYLIRAVTNNCFNHLNSLNKKKVEYLENVSEVFQRFKETNLSHLDFDVNISAALNVLHAKLEPLERAVFVLKEVFDFDYEDLQKMLDKKKEHCRQLVSRAKKKLSEGTAKISLPDTNKWIDSFKKACHFGNASDLIQELKSDISAADKK